jgi:hypothetical protein
VYVIGTGRIWEVQMKRPLLGVWEVPEYQAVTFAFGLPNHFLPENTRITSSGRVRYTQVLLQNFYVFVDE